MVGTVPGELPGVAAVPGVGMGRLSHGHVHAATAGRATWPYQIFSSVLRIRICIRSRFNPLSGSGSGFGIRIQEGKMAHIQK
jgi:hypothetical protein